MDVHADVALLGHERLAGVDAHPDPDRPGPECPLRLGRGGDGVGRPRERDEERVALGVHLDPVVSPEGLADHAPMLFEEIGVGRPVLLKETSRPFDVGEEKRDRAGWQGWCAHRAIISHRRAERPTRRAIREPVA